MWRVYWPRTTTTNTALQPTDPHATTRTGEAATSFPIALSHCWPCWLVMPVHILFFILFARTVGEGSDSVVETNAYCDQKAREKHEEAHLALSLWEGGEGGGDMLVVLYMMTMLVPSSSSWLEPLCRDDDNVADKLWRGGGAAAVQRQCRTARKVNVVIAMFVLVNAAATFAVLQLRLLLSIAVPHPHFLV